MITINTKIVLKPTNKFVIDRNRLERIMNLIRADFKLSTTVMSRVDCRKQPALASMTVVGYRRDSAISLCALEHRDNALV